MRTREGELLTQIILAIFRTNGQLLAAGDELAAPFGMTSARWQVLGAVGLSERPLSVPQIASAMGITRQGVQRQINLLTEQDLLKATPNPGNKRSPLYVLTSRGRGVLSDIDRAQARWVNELARDIAREDLEVAGRVLGGLSERIDRD